MEDIRKLIVHKNTTIKDTMKKIDEGGLGIAFVVDEEKKLVGVVTDGDIRRAILKGINIEKKPIKDIMNKKPVVVKHELTNKDRRHLLSRDEVRKKIPLGGALKIPVLDDEGKVKGITFLTGEKREMDRYRSVRLKRAVRSILIVGGAGYLGSVLCRKLLERGYRVKVLDNLMYGDEGIKDLYENDNFEFIKGDIRDIQTVMDSIKGVDAVIHLAAIVGDPASTINPEETIEINYLGTKMLAEVCKYNQINRFIFASTCSVYGSSHDPDEFLNEDSPPNPVSLYAEMKLKSEEGLMDLIDENFSPTIFRMATLYGLSPRMRFDLVINLLTAKAAIDKKITIFGGEQWRPFLHVEDAAEAYIRCLEAPIDKIRGEIFNVGSNEQNYTINEIGEMIKKFIPEAQIIREEKNKDRRNYKVSFDKIEKILGFKPKYGVEDGIKQIYASIKEGKFKNYTDPKYSNYKYLQEKLNAPE